MPRMKKKDRDLLLVLVKKLGAIGANMSILLRKIDVEPFPATAGLCERCGKDLEAVLPDEPEGPAA